MNHHLIPVNAARCPFHATTATARCAWTATTAARGYEPNSYGDWRQQPEFAEPPLKISGDAAHWDYREDDADYFTQPASSSPPDEAGRAGSLFANTARAMATRRG